MALDGLVISNIADELSQSLTGGRINKISQPESDAVIFSIKNNGTSRRLLISANPTVPLIYLTGSNPVNPPAAPNFCMLLRKHLSGGKITGISQPGMERILHITVEHPDEMGDVSQKILIVELMGRHSNIILCQPDMTIIDSIKHIPSNVSSLREVLPGRPYFIAATQHKLDPVTVTKDQFTETVFSQPMPLGKAVYSSLTGISPLIAEEICFRASLDSSVSARTLSEAEQLHLYGTFSRLMDDITGHRYYPNIVYQNGTPKEFSCVKLKCYGDLEVTEYDSISEVLEQYYSQRDAASRIRQRSSDLRKTVGTALDRCRKKYDLQQKQLKDTEERDRYRVYGELINTYGYSCEPGDETLECVDYYTNETVLIPLDPKLSAHENSLKYFEKYSKLKRTYDALSVQIPETEQELEHLDSISTSLDIAVSADDLAQIREELIKYGYMKRRSSAKGKMNTKDKKSRGAKIKSTPFHFVSSDGFHMYAGKNNTQNEELTFKFASGSDWWFHAKDMPGSHVIVKAEGRQVPQTTFEEAARLAAWFSKGRGAGKTEVDYVQKKELRKTPGGPPGFVIYHTNSSMMAPADITGITEIK